ncbi:amino acid adenylation domain-containing protein [Shewanella violacea]|uniref:Carrier domain-containing protein n=1 Tax=Shewanella violacea (strain JCM 10179 / CIP 106290 / LMG 19151 / DSS12) TaxID=637905 RepID=D4ZDP4_SHEVD|nr:amino acid adenylation domain-containing protein [Shewanella violacea]BAJ03955.1 hypothetical protein SVI_3984 [Shewanella violacea DSS12]
MEPKSFNLAEQTSLVAVLQHRAQITPNKVAYIYLENGEDIEVPITYAELDCRARELAAQLQGKNPLIQQERVLLIYPQGIDFIVAFFATLYAGAIAVLVYPPSSKKMAQRLNGIVEDCNVKLILSTAKVISRMDRMNMVTDAGEQDEDAINIPAQYWINSDNLDPEAARDFKQPIILGEHLAFLQYTSGSTGTPKGVMISHSNLMANQAAIKDIYQHDDKTIFVGWLPLIHDMGLIGNVLQPMYLGISLVFMSPLHFVQKPVRWLRAISKYQATTSGGPNFAYDLCVRKIADADLADLDLSSWTLAYNGAEPVRKETVSRFNQRFSVCGLKPESHMAVYGLAEATLIVTGTNKQAVLATSDNVDYMSSGTCVEVDRVRIVNPETCVEADEQQEGEIWVHGPSVAKGYWNRPEETQTTFKAQILGSELHYMRTGDTGYCKNGEIHVTGRIKDIVIVQGKNFHPEDIEWSLIDVQGLRVGGSVAFSLDVVDEQGQTSESLVVVAGVLESDSDKHPSIISNIRSFIYQDHQLQVDRVVLIKPKQIPMTTSGKVQRRLTRQMLVANEFTILGDDLLAAVDDKSTQARSSIVAATTKAELELTSMWGAILGLSASDIGITDNFFDLGGSSLTMLELSIQLNTTMELLFRYPTISSYLYRTSEYEFPEVEKDIYLPAANIDRSLEGETGISLITGGTGFFGLHFLQSMMQRTQDKFVLLIRGENDDVMNKKFTDAVAYFHMEKDIDIGRVILIRGDLSEHHVGIPDDKYPWVCQNVDKIFHIGSHVNNWLPYEGIREINVDGTRSLLALARTGRKKEFHYTSTSTFSPDKADPSVFLEGDTIDKNDINRFFGYDISKYASEQMCRIAREEGLICNIYRLVWIGGHIETGLTKLNDGFNIMLRILITIKAFPKGNYLHDITPVDLLADGMASVQGKAKNTDFNLTSQSKESIDMKRLAVMLRGMGYQIDEVSRTEFVERLKNYPLEQWDEHCKSYRQLVIRLFEDPTPKIESFYDGSNFRKHVDPNLLVKMEQKFIDTWFEKTVNFLVSNNALPTPEGNVYDDEIKTLLTWGQHKGEFTHQQCIHHVFAQQVQRTPEAIAVRFNQDSLTYQELNERSEQVAQYLRNHAIAPGAVVGLCIERSTHLIVSILAIFKAGCAYLPLDPNYPAASLDHMIEDCAVKHILVANKSPQALVLHREKLISLTDVDFAMYAASELAPGISNTGQQSRPSDLAYVIYTSGTTGKPKGVQVEHRSVVNHSLSMADVFGLTGQDNVLQFSTINFDSFIEEVFPSLFTGATVVMIEQEKLTQVSELTELILQQSVNVVKFSTAYWHTVSKVNLQQLGVRLLAIGGEEADIQKYNEWRVINTDIPLINTYGPTETTVSASYSVLNGPLDNITIGRPIANTQAYILDSNLVPVAIGFVGELYIAGEGVSRGYLNNAELTAQVFIDNPFSGHSKMYKTGDLVRWDNAGNIEFMGRTDNQVKVRGYRIELGAIESVLNDYQGISQAVVVLKQIETKKKVVAYVVANNEAIDIAELGEHLSQALPSYMLPNLILPLDDIPLNPNGKVDRGLLEKMEINSEKSINFTSPVTDNEIKMTAIWQDVLAVSSVGLHDDFMELGGHSLLVMSLISEVNQEFNANVSINDIYESATVAKLLAVVENNDYEQGSNLVEFPNVHLSKTELTQVKPLFLVHGLGGHLASFYPLVKNLKQQLHDVYDIDIAVYGLEANGFKAQQQHFASVDEMVSEYIKLIKAKQASGPYLIGGWSYGVSIAYHIVQALINQGDEVEVFISIDAEAPYVPKDFAEFLRDNDVSGLNDLYQDEKLAALLKNFGKRFGFISNDKECIKQQFYRFLGYSQDDSQDQVERFNKVAIANLLNAKDFNPSTINPVNSLLVKASQSVFDDYVADWYDLLDSKMISLLTLTGDHWSIMQEQELASNLARVLAVSSQVVINES